MANASWATHIYSPSFEKEKEKSMTMKYEAEIISFMLIAYK